MSRRSIVGHPTVTQRAYAQPPEVKERAVRFAEAAVRNGLGLDGMQMLSAKKLGDLTRQIERDFLVHLMEIDRVKSTD